MLTKNFFFSSLATFPGISVFFTPEHNTTKQCFPCHCNFYSLIHYLCVTRNHSTQGMTRTLNVQPDQESTSRFQSRTDMMYSSVVEMRVNVEEVEVRVVLLVLVLEVDVDVDVEVEVRMEPSRQLSNNGG